VLPYFRWQWLWRSRRRLLACGLVLFVLGGLYLAFALHVAWPRLVHRWFVLHGGIAVGLIGVGGYMALQALFSPAGAFGDHDHDDSREHRRRAWRRKRAAPADDEPIPLADDTGEEPAVRVARCPTCHQRMTVPADEVAECPKCHERFRPD
jgi:hypothetical protein